MFDPVVAVTLTIGGLAALAAAYVGVRARRRLWRVVATVLGLAGCVTLIVGASLLAGMSVA